MKSMLPLLAAMAALSGATSLPNPVVRNADLSFKPSPPKADENLDIEVEWSAYQGDTIDIIVEFFPTGTASTVTVTVTRPGKATIAIPKGVTSVNARDKAHQANAVTEKVTP